MCLLEQEWSIVESGYEVKRADDFQNQRDIIKDVIEGIVENDLIVADLSDANPNVYYELGIAHTLGRNVILMAQDVDEVPFDIRQHRVREYATHFSRMDKARSELRELLGDVLAGKVKFGNPVADYEPAVVAKADGLEDPGSEAENEELGLVDYQVLLESGTASLNEALRGALEHFRGIGASMEEGAIQVDPDSPKKNQKTLRGLATQLDSHSRGIQKQNGELGKSLDAIDTAANGLFGGEFSFGSEDPAETEKAISSLRGAEEKGRECRESIVGLKSAIDGLPRIQRKFNQARNRLSAEVGAFAGSIEVAIAVLGRARRGLEGTLPRA